MPRDTAVSSSVPGSLDSGANDTVAPFVSPSDTLVHHGVDTIATDDEGTANPFISDAPAPVSAVKEKRWILDLLLDISGGASLTYCYDVLPQHVSTEGKGNVVFSLGVKVPFLQYAYTKVSIRYLRLKFITQSSTPNVIDMYVTETGDEILSFVTASVDVGLQLPLGRVTPYIYCALEPAYLTAAGQHTITETFTTFSDSAFIYSKTADDRNTTLHRERHQIFIGPGIGMEFSFGYGTVYLDGSFRYALFSPGDENSKPYRTASTLCYFPLSLGIRFYL